MLKSSSFGTRYSAIVALFLSLTTVRLSGQIPHCATPDMTLSETEALFQGVVSSEIEVAGSAVWNIPVWVTLVQDDNGYSEFNGSFSPIQFVEGVNQYFNNGMEFYHPVRAASPGDSSSGIGTRPSALGGDHDEDF